MEKYLIIVLSYPETLPKEAEIICQLFDSGLSHFHLRKPNFSVADYSAWIHQIPKKYWQRIVLHHHYHLALELGLGGVHLTETSRKNQDLAPLIQQYKRQGLQISAAIHDLKDLDILGQLCDYVLISPVFNSISKSNYKANLDLDISHWKDKTKAKLIALGGISPENIPLALERGFGGIATLGYIWQQAEQATQRFHQLQQAIFRPYVLSIAGFDPSAGAGVLADVKTFEQKESYGLSTCTALTIQNDIHFKSVQWVDEATILEQINVLKTRFDIKAVKIGLVENWTVLQKVIDALEGKKIVFDPILKASAGFDFHASSALQSLIAYLPKLSLITPNREEIIRLIPNKTPVEAAALLSLHCPTLLKGGHHESRLGEDELWQNGKRIAVFEAQKIAVRGKHGSGCVLSSAITTELAKGQTLISACQNGKAYVEAFLNSNSSLLGYHMKNL